eukprot:TRINITY_DN6978_c0_g1_i1.p1 TRINITY_DN6978_c0_g1~~TRINITY_DN6978_c0_g1_i1.p1  ORF type:complete len:182 (+),score=33.81 TRINITY_DN6978_c0_g1_i1:2-547(+)
MEATIRYAGKEFVPVRLSDIGIKFYPQIVDTEHIEKDSKVITEMGEVWTPNKWKDLRKPLHIDHIQEKERSQFSKNQSIRVLDLPIKFPESNEYRIPSELLPFEKTIRQIADFEFSLRIPSEPTYCYLTIDQAEISPGSTQRTAGCHVDGQNPRKFIENVEISLNFFRLSRSTYRNENASR